MTPAPLALQVIIAVCVLGTFLSAAIAAYVCLKTAAAVSRLENKLLLLLRDYATKEDLKDCRELQIERRPVHA
jgi:hypothetical protein